MVDQEAPSDNTLWCLNLTPTLLHHCDAAKNSMKQPRQHHKADGPRLQPPLVDRNSTMVDQAEPGDNQL
jgi:hypothetical protein